MSDLLRRMIERTFATTPRIEPPPLSRYEPGGIGDLPVGQDFGARAVITHSPIVESSASRESLVSEPWRSAMKNSADQVVTHAERMPTESDAPPVRARTKDRELLSELTGPSRHESVEASDVRLNSRPRPERPFESGLVSPQTRISAPSPSLPLAIAQPRQTQRETLAVTGTAGHNSQEQSGAESAAPDITVSIGHIELRAAASPQPQRKPNARPQLSLDHFLQGKKPGALR